MTLLTDQNQLVNSKPNHNTLGNPHLLSGLNVKAWKPTNMFLKHLIIFIFFH